MAWSNFTARRLTCCHVAIERRHLHQLLAQGSSQADIAAELGAGKGGDARLGNQAYALQGNAAESADHQSQNFEALVLKLHSSEAVQASAQALQEQVVQITEIYKDVENDGYFESTQWVSATDASGNPQGLLVLDYEQNGLIETRDILNIGGNGAGNTDLQRNNVQWLDANADGVLDASDPAFCAIRLWVDVNQDGRLDSGEEANLQSLQITGIDIRTAQVTYADGHTAALHATDLQADTEGVRFTQVQLADAQGAMHALDARGEDYCYTFDSCLRTWNMPKRPVSFTSANDAAWCKAA